MDVLPIESINHVKNKMLIDVQYAKRKGKKISYLVNNI